MTREEVLALFRECGEMLKQSACDGLNDLGGSIYPAEGPNAMLHMAVQLNAMYLVGDMIQDWAQDKLNIPECTFTHSHTREFCGNPGCRES